MACRRVRTCGFTISRRAYYRRHLLLHEGTHAFMGKFLGGCGPGWYMEGTAELFGTHRMDDRRGELQMRVMPRDREEVPMWGRIKLIRDAVAAGHGLDLSAVMALDNRKQMDDESYAWCWAAAKFLDSHPRYRDRFRQLKDHVTDQDFNEVGEASFTARIGRMPKPSGKRSLPRSTTATTSSGWRLIFGAARRSDGKARACDDCGRSRLAVVGCVA